MKTILKVIFLIVIFSGELVAQSKANQKLEDPVDVIEDLENIKALTNLEAK
ncbi:hypothetical protein [uncultured Croceitalea sp.]|uniref:hypothetical protein n=1 Tax=uncultured Croceitalea sp. TaxID=1798908 RepID=UPI003305757C